MMIQGGQGPLPKRIFEADYVTGVLGIDLPLNESYPYSPAMQERIIEEQLVLEGFFSDFKKLGGDTKNAALTLRYIMGDSKRLEQYAGIVKKSMKEFYENVVEFLEGVIEGITGLPDQITDKIAKILEWAKKLVEKVKKLAKAALGMSGWKGAMLVSGALVGIGFVWSQVKDVAPDIMDGLAKVKEFVADKIGKLKKESVEMLTKVSLLEASNVLDLIIEQEESMLKKAADKVKEVMQPLLAKAKEMGVDALKGLAVEALTGALTGGIASAFQALQKVFGGAKLVFEFLGGPLKKFVAMMKGDVDPKEEAAEAASGEDDPTEKNESVNMEMNEKKLRELIREALKENYNSMSPAGKSLAQRAKRMFSKDYPGVKVGINTREGWITVNGKKAVNMSQASGSPMQVEDVIDKMKQSHLGR